MRNTTSQVERRLPYNLIYLVQPRSTGNDLMQVMPLLLLFSLVGIGVIAALSAALYAALPHYFLECAERHGRFHGLLPDEAAQSGTPDELLPVGTLSELTA
jgi:hypothetical protein